MDDDYVDEYRRSLPFIGQVPPEEGPILNFFMPPVDNLSQIPSGTKRVLIASYMGSSVSIVVCPTCHTICLQEDLTGHLRWHADSATNTDGIDHA